MEALTSMIANPLEAAAGLVESMLPASATNAAAGGAAAPNTVFTEDTLRMLMHNLFTGDSRLQQQMLSKYYASSATFTLNEGLLTLQDRGGLTQLLTGLQLLVGVEPEVLDIISTSNRAMLLLNLKLQYRLAPWTWSKYTRVQVPSTITLTFGRSPDALLSAAADDVILEHRQELSLPDLMWWNPAWPWLNAHLWAPVSGRWLSGLLQLEQPLLARMQSYLADGAGYAQAAIWTAQDVLTGTKQGLPAATRMPVTLSSQPGIAAGTAVAAATGSGASPQAAASGPSTPVRAADDRAAVLAHQAASLAALNAAAAQDAAAQQAPVEAAVATPAAQPAAAAAEQASADTVAAAATGAAAGASAGAAERQLLSA